MKKLRVLLITVCVLAFCLLALTSCDGALDKPSGFSFNEDTQMLSWEKVEGAIGYSVLVGDKEKSTKSNFFIVDITEKGVYEIKVKALGDGKSMQDSDYAVYNYEKNESETGLRYELINNNTEYKLVGLGSASGDVVMEETFRGKPVTAIAEGALSNNGKLTSFTINSKVKEIPKKAFYNCNALISVTIPENVVKIGPNAFQSCRSLTKVDIPSGVTVIEEYAFSYCRALTEASLSPETTKIGGYAFSDCMALTKINIPDKVTSIGEYAFSGCNSATELHLSAVLESIGDYAFYYCQLIDEVVIPDTVTGIGEGAFESCAKIPSITLPESVTSIGDRAFAFCELLADIQVGENLEAVGRNILLDTAYYNDYAEDVVYLGNWIIACKNPEVSAGKDLTPLIKEGTIGIADLAFRGCNGFTGVNLPDIKYVGDYAFYGCEKLVNVYLGPEAVRIGDYAFTLCTSLKQLNRLQNTKITYIGDFAFNGCSKLGSSMSPINLPDTVESIGTQAFNNTLVPSKFGVLYVSNWVVGTSGNFFIGDVQIEDGTVGIADYSFNQCLFTGKIIFPPTVESIGRGAFLACTNLRIEEFSRNLKKIDDYAFYLCSNALFGTAEEYMEYHLTLPDGLEYIGRSAFYQTSMLGLTVPGSCKYIGEFAFYGCSLLGSLQEYNLSEDGSEEGSEGEESTGPEYSDSNVKKVRYHLILEEGIEEIGSRAFFGCSGLIDLTIPDSLTTLGIRAFYKCESLENVVIGASLTEVPAYSFYGCVELENVVFPHSIKTIDKYAFRGCEKLAELNLPADLKTIGKYAFHGCIALTNLSLPKGVTYVGDFAFRKNVSATSAVIHSGIVELGQHALYSDNALTIYCEGNEKSDYWHERWNSSYRPVIWGCTLSEDKSYVVSFVKADGAIDNADAVNGILAPCRDGYEFAGWSLSEDGEVAYSASEIINAEDGSVLYAIWAPVAAQ
ncbi:MAG: leucine-rich repeat protein [Clostridia bacterium]|nr:leucine-rich repeat protein [Clostridia bacterium]